MKKLNLEQLKVQSFVTKQVGNISKTIYGGDGTTKTSAANVGKSTNNVPITLECTYEYGCSVNCDGWIKDVYDGN